MFIGTSFRHWPRRELSQNARLFFNCYIMFLIVVLWYFPFPLSQNAEMTSANFFLWISQAGTERAGRRPWTELRDGRYPATTTGLIRVPAGLPDGFDSGSPLASSMVPVGGRRLVLPGQRTAPVSLCCCFCY